MISTNERDEVIIMDTAAKQSNEISDYQYIEKYDRGFPEILKEYEAMPEYLYVKGNLPDPEKKCVAIVGARSCSMYGKNHAIKLARMLAENGVQVISGLAFGIDASAHQGCLEGGGRTFAVMGCGIDICYPESNRRIYRSILNSGGGIISEYPPGTPPLPHHFPIRNRIISAMSDAVVIIEAKSKSGSLITANYALEQGKTLYAMPGRVNDVLSAGCNELISQGAFPLLSVYQLLRDLGISDDSIRKNSAGKQEIVLGPDEKELITCLTDDPKTLGELDSEVSFSTSALSCVLIKLQLKGLVDEPVPGSYCRAY